MGGTGRGLRSIGLVGSILAAALLACQPAGQDVALVGTVERTLVEVSAPVSETIVEIPVARGQHVETGDVLVALDSTLARADLAGAEAALAGAHTAQAVADTEWARVQQLQQRSAASRQALDQARLQRDQAGAALREAEARLDAARKHLRDLTVVAPVPGVVDQIPFDPGERVPAAGVVAVLLADGTPWIRVWLPERALAAVRPGTPAEIHIDGVPGTHPGHVLDVSREPEFTPHYALTERERVYLVYETRVALDADTDPPLRPGIPAQVTIPVEPPREPQR